MSRPTIIINELDAERIDRLLEKPEFASLPVADALNEELDRAQMCTPETMPHDVVTMNSQVKFRNLTTGEELTRTLVYPAQMTDSSTQLSVLAPVGAALLGLRTGDTIHPPCTEDAPASSFRKFTRLCYIGQKPLNPRLVCCSAVGTVMGEILVITLVFLIILAILVVAVLYLERHW